MRTLKIAWSIDDDAEMGYIIRLMLKSLGFEARSFLHPREAVQLMLNGTSPDLIILDMNMPGVTGIDVLEFIRSRERWDHISIVILSVESADEMVERAMNLGADGYVFKPMTMDELDEAIELAEKNRQNKIP
ncbi:MAG: response regulator [Anaerolineales bacterium]|nr:response regulator [Anaerolineales bacterium]